jgi:hypothetical protein
MNPARNYVLFLLALILLTGCISTNAAPTAAIQTRVPELGQTLTSEDGVITLQYPQGWTAETRGDRIVLSSEAGLIQKIGRETFDRGQVAADIAYVRREEAAASFGLPANFTLNQLAERTQNDLVEMTTERLTINGAPAIGQTGLISLDAVVADIYAVTFERDGILITVTTYGSPGELDDIRGVSTQIAESITLNTSED